LATYEQVQALFGDAALGENGYEVQTWRQRSFCKSYKTGDVPAALRSLEVEYNKSKQTLKLNFELEMNLNTELEA
jgi:hypothetical protein